MQSHLEEQILSYDIIVVYPTVELGGILFLDHFYEKADSVSDEFIHATLIVLSVLEAQGKLTLIYSSLEKTVLEKRCEF